MKACARLHTEFAALLSDTPDIPTPDEARDIAHKLRILAMKYEIQADDACLFDGEKNDSTIQD